MSATKRLFDMLGGFLVGISVLVAVVAIADPEDPVPRTIPYEGYIEEDGAAITETDVEFVFRIYDQASGGEPIWTSDATVNGEIGEPIEPILLDVTAGRFAVELGRVGAPLTERVFSSSAIYVGFSIDGVELTGRQRLVNPWLAVNGAAWVNDGTLTVADLNVTGDASVDGDLEASGEVRGSTLVTSGILSAYSVVLTADIEARANTWGSLDDVADCGQNCWMMCPNGRFISGVYTREGANNDDQIESIRCSLP